jgi:hypothetical protein
LTIFLWPLAVLLLTVPEVSAQGDAARRPPPREYFPDTNVYVCPPSVTGRVECTHGPLEGYGKIPGDIAYGTGDVRYRASHGYASFDLGEMPDSIEVSRVELRYYQYYSYKQFVGGGLIPQTTLRLVNDVNSSAYTLYVDCGSGPVIDPEQLTYNGWVARPFKGSGLEAFDSCRVRGESINLGLGGGYCAPGGAFGVGPYHPTRAYLEIQYSTNASYCDIAALDAGFDSFPLVVGDSIVVVGRFTNTGNSTAYAVPVCASCTGTTGDTIIVDSLAPDDTTSVRIALPPAAEPGIASLVLSTDVQGDWCRHNDTAIKSTYVFPHGTRSAEDFEPEHSPAFPPPGWFVSNGGDTNTWYHGGPGDRNAHSGDYYAACGGYGQTDDWLVTYGLSPDSSTADTVGFFLSAVTSSSWCKAEVWAIGSQDPGDTLDMLLADTLRAGGWREYRVGLDQFDGQVVYIGLRSAVTTGVPLQVDDVWFTSGRVPGVNEQTSLGAPLGLTLFPNPAPRGPVRLSYPHVGSEPVEVEMCDILGRVVSSQRVSISAAGGAGEMDCWNLAAGVYFVSLRSGAIAARSKLVVH